jgi:hypothetical protein
VKHILSVLALVLGTSSLGLAGTNIIDDFENTDLLGWQAASSTGQNSNVTSQTNVAGGIPPIFTTSYATSGVTGGRFMVDWTIPGSTSGVTTNYYVSADGAANPFWGWRISTASPSSAPTNTFSNTAILRVDIKNENAYPFQFALYVNSAADTQLERGPMQTIAANATATYEWNLGTQAATGFITGNGALPTGNMRVAGFVVYISSASGPPSSSAFSAVLDKLRDDNAQTDVTAPSVPKIISVTQGASAGQAIVKWSASPEVDTAKYRVYKATDANFNTPTYNRLTFPTTPEIEVNAPATQATVTVTPGTSTYFKVTAVDNAVPNANESVSDVALGCNLRADGSAPADRVVIDSDRNIPGTSGFSDEGYFHAIVYNAKALTDNGRTFDSATAYGVDNGGVTLTPKASGAVIWANLLDGSSSASVALTTTSVNALTTFYNADGNLLISGAGTAEDLSTRGSAQSTFLANILKAGLVSPNAASADIALISPLTPVTGLSTNVSGGTVFTRNVGFNTSSNEVLSPLAGATAAAQYTSGSLTAGVANSQRVVFFGFGIESITDSASTSAETTQSAPKKAAVMNSAIQYLLAPAPGAAAKEWELFE